MDEEPPINRRLAAIVAADTARYSRLVHEDEAATAWCRLHPARDQPPLAGGCTHD